MRNSLYEEFNCKNEVELYEKIKNQDEDIKPLIEFLDYARANIKNNRQAITSPDTLVEYVKSITLPTKDAGTIIFANTKNHPVHLKRTRLSQRNSIKESLREGLMAGANSVFLAFSNETPDKRIEETKEYFEKIGMKVVDTIGYSKENNSFLSMLAGRSYYASKTYEIANDSENAYGDKDYSLKDKYEDFTSYFASNELIDLNLMENINEIKEILKIGFQHHQQEIFGIIVYDKDDKIIGAEELFKGATDAAIVDLKIIARSLLNYQDVKGMAVFHNHPSGNPTPSREDLQMTNKIKNLTEIFDIELLDHFIVGKEKTLSFSQEVDSFQSENQSYQDKQEEMSLLKEDKSAYNKAEANLRVGDKIKTSLSDETIVLDIDKDNAVLFDGRQFVEVYGLQSNDEKFFWNHGNYSNSYPQKKDSNIVDTLNNLIDKDHEGFVKALIMQEMGVDSPDLLEELYERYMRNDGVNLINDYFEELIYELEGEIPIIGNRAIETDKKTNKEDDLCNKIDDFINSYVELSNAMYEVDYDFAEDYPLDKSFHDIEFMDWAEATKRNLSKVDKGVELGKISKETKKESTIAKLNKLKDKVAKDSIGRIQEKAENKKNDREMQ
ncbi:JAB domain-containing protein [Clostridium algidicarnis]|uniref:JAB domain-containing protein n=1 Tax=Clostridium algidicarnis TaxID=37659 RepID=UPI001C0B2CF8|nr:JAB domain-containing protein [Clostridium algidicarnis]MBU3194725.1 JAB domain-containing protein [Clostridium algidicarnis]MBU3207767.1 JAB domain-containing protein [Clostridium algidicarnis]